MTTAEKAIIFHIPNSFLLMASDLFSIKWIFAAHIGCLSASTNIMTILDKIKLFVNYNFIVYLEKIDFIEENHRESPKIPVLEVFLPCCCVRLP